MTARSRLNQEVIAKLGGKKLAELVLGEAQRNPGFRRRVAAAMAAAKGPDAVAAIIDRRLTALKRARGYIDWEGIRNFAEDLRATVTTITEELGTIDPDAAVNRLVRFLDTTSEVFERIDDSNGHVQDVYYAAADAILGLSPALSQKSKASLLELLHPGLAYAENDFCSHILGNLLPALPAISVEAWDQRLAGEIQLLQADKPSDEDWRRRGQLDRLIGLRQLIADYRGDCDAFITLEERRGQNPDTLAIAERLLKATRYAEALEWVRKPGHPHLNDFAWRDVATSPEITLTTVPERVRLELRILDANDQGEEAQQLRWKFFLETLDGEMLREYVRRLGDFEEFEVLDRAFAHATSFKDPLHALQLFVFWPRLDLASQLVLGSPARWDGRQYYALVPAAEALEESYPVAATVLYRALLDTILAQARSKAYGHAARYFERLNALAKRTSPDSLQISHDAYKSELRIKHGRKTGFWAYIDPSLR